MKNSLLIFVFSFLSAVSFAGGAGRPVSDFTGAFQLLKGGVLIDQNSGKWNCPDSFEAQLTETREARGEEQKVTSRTLSFLADGEQVLPTFEFINLGRSWSGVNYEEAYTNKKSLVLEQGFEIFRPGTPNRGPYDPGTPPTRETYVTYTYEAKFQKDGTLVIKTSKRGSSSCLYRKL